jgi:hypothetical protein
MSPHLLRCQGLAVDEYSFALGRLEAEATSTFAQLGLHSQLGKENIAWLAGLRVLSYSYCL